MIAVGQTIGNYTITAKLGEGGMGVVYLAEHPVIGRKVAMKAIHPELSRNPEVVSRFMTEAKAVNQIGNEHIVDINDFGTTSDGEFYFVMEFLQGESLADRLKRERLFEPSRALQITSQVADALAASHSHGIIHRDLKPENIFLINRGNSKDFVKVLDFGLAKLTQGDEKVTHKTRTGSVMGTPYYMSPEQCEGKANIDLRSDLYALGVILFECLTGRVPFTGEGYGEIIVKHITQPAPAPRSLNASLNKAHEALLYRALAKNREERFQTMEEFRAAMLDPDKYLTTAPAIRATRMDQGAMPTMMSDQGVSGQVVFGGPVGAGQVEPYHPGPMPSTFRHTAGEVMDDDQIPVEKSRKGLVLGALALAVMVGGGFYYMKQKGGGATLEGGKIAAGLNADPTPPAPTTVTLSFKSEPAGAIVVRKDTGKQVGTTPFELPLAQGNDTLEFVFKKDGFQDRTRAIAPDSSRELETSLVPIPVRTVEAPPPPKADTPKPPAPTTKRHSGGSRKKANRPLNDEDGVLPPTF